MGRLPDRRTAVSAVTETAGESPTRSRRRPRTTYGDGENSTPYGARIESGFGASLCRRTPQAVRAAPQQLRSGQRSKYNGELPSGAVAQLEEYLNGIQGVTGSSPVSSTNFLSLPEPQGSYVYSLSIRLTVGSDRLEAAVVFTLPAAV